MCADVVKGASVQSDGLLRSSQTDLELEKVSFSKLFTLESKIEKAALMEHRWTGDIGGRGGGGGGGKGEVGGGRGQAGGVHEEEAKPRCPTTSQWNYSSLSALICICESSAAKCICTFKLIHILTLFSVS